MSVAAEPKSRPATYADLEDLPHNLIGEIINGVLHGSPRLTPQRNLVATRLGACIGTFYALGLQGGPGGWEILNRPEVHLGDNVVVPDHVGWRLSRMPVFPQDRFTLEPDWVCEILSPATARLDRCQKVALYRRARVSHVWLVEPILKTIEVLTWTEAAWLWTIFDGSGEAVAIPPFEAVPLNLDRVWRGVATE